MASKIEKHGLGGLALDLLRKGKTTYEIAEILSEKLKDQGIDDSISQKTASRFLKDYREDKREYSRSKVLEQVDLDMASDLEAIEEAKQFFLVVMRDKAYDIRVRGAAGEKLLKAVDLKWRHGFGDKGEGAGEQLTLDDLLAEIDGVTRGLPDAIQTTLR